jgi:hypothetical protein
MVQIKTDERLMTTPNSSGLNRWYRTNKTVSVITIAAMMIVIASTVPHRVILGKDLSPACSSDHARRLFIGTKLSPLFQEMTAGMEDAIICAATAVTVAVTVTNNRAASELGGSLPNGGGFTSIFRCPKHSCANLQSFSMIERDDSPCMRWAPAPDPTTIQQMWPVFRLLTLNSIKS